MAVRATRRGRMFGVLVIALTVGLIYAAASGWKPLAFAQGALDRIGALSRPGPAWTARIGAPPDAAVIAGGAVIIRRRAAVEARAIKNGERLWERSVDWSAVAGAVGGDDEGGPVVVTGSRGAGLSALDATTGRVRWRVPEAIGAWTFREAVLALSCPDSGKCQLTSYGAVDGVQRWRVTVPGVGPSAAGANSETLGVRDITGTYADAVAAAPAQSPSLLGLPADRDAEVVDAARGRRLPTVDRPGGSGRVWVIGDKVIVTTATPKGSGCRFVIEARNPVTGGRVWRHEGYDPGTVSGSGCGQRRAPTGGGRALAVRKSNDRDALISIGDGEEVWVGAAGERIRAVDDHLALVTAGTGVVRAIDTGSGATRWERPIRDGASPVLCGSVSLLTDRTDGRLVGYDSGSGRRLADLRTRADVVGCGASGLVLARGRTIGLVPFA